MGPIETKVAEMSNVFFNDGLDDLRDEDLSMCEQSLDGDQDLIMEHILDNINATPIGKLLKRIACLPEVRQDKILSVRQQLTEGSYEVNDRLNLALDKVLEELTT